MIFFLTTLINIRKIEEVQILVLVPIHFQYVCFKWPNSFSMVSNSDNRVKAWYVYSIRYCILNNNLASIKWKLAIDFHLIFLLLFPIDCLTFKGFQSFFSKISLHKILKVKSFHVFFYMLLFKSFLLSFVFPEFVLILHWTKKNVLFFSGYHVSKMNLLLTENVLHHYLESKKWFFLFESLVPLIIAFFLSYGDGFSIRLNSF